ncbi:MAG TPA: hypothetical protein VM096_09105, partial [Vicinamibacterales bacterium]|nr:hypothetical protein [Vicinamibacterales bacterium]
MLRQAPALWFVLVMTAVLWPSRFLGPLDGAPLDRRFEAILLGLVLPWLFWLGRDACRSRTFRTLVLALLMWKGGTAMAAVQQGLCATFRSPQPLTGKAFDIRIDEPRGFLRSWDLRAGLWDDEPSCTAILSQPLSITEEFPAWFVNITDQMLRRREFTMTVRGVVTGDTGESQAREWSALLGAEPWAFDPDINGMSVWRAPLVTTEMPSSIDRVLAPWAWLVAPSIALAIVAMLLRAAIEPLVANVMVVGWIVLSSATAVALTIPPMTGLQRAAGLIVSGALFVRVPPSERRLSSAAWMVGAPWLAFFAAVSSGLVGRFSAYSMDDWLAYQIAGYRIYMNGHWVEAGTLTFNYQPLYRWITGALHLVFGDSSVGEVYWDASFLLAGALLAWKLAAGASGFRWGIAA